MSYDFCTRPSETLNISSRHVIATHSSAEIPISVSHYCAERGCKRRDSSTTREQRPTRRHNVACSSNSCGCSSYVFLAACPIDLPLLSPLKLNDYELALKNAATRSQTALKISPHCARHDGASTAAFKLLLDLPGIQNRGRWLGANAVRRYEKACKHSASGATRSLRRQQCRAGCEGFQLHEALVWQQLWTFVLFVVK